MGAFVKRSNEGSCQVEKKTFPEKKPTVQRRTGSGAKEKKKKAFSISRISLANSAITESKSAHSEQLRGEIAKNGKGGENPESDRIFFGTLVMYWKKERGGGFVRMVKGGENGRSGGQKDAR